MLTQLSGWIVAVIWIALSAISWLAFVPGVISLTTFVLVNGAVALAIAGLALVRGARPERSLAGILYDTEQNKPPGA